MFRTTNSGTGWTNVQSGDFEEVEIHPTNTNIIYAVRKSGTATQFFKSVNGGSSFSQTGTGWPVPTFDDHQERTELAVSPDNPDYVYAHCSGSANRGSGFYGVYASTNQGANWTFKCCGPQPAGIPSLPIPILWAGAMMALMMAVNIITIWDLPCHPQIRILYCWLALIFGFPETGVHHLPALPNGLIPINPIMCTPIFMMFITMPTPEKFG
ncbi:MAG: hypothetical protein IPL20_03850 [Saprospiraceae bacterium]|nr:hypothetical protein [Saprospiraceae bacterium]